MAITYTLIYGAPNGFFGNAILFNSIPSTYTDLVIQYSARSAQSSGFGQQMQLLMNGAGANQSDTLLQGTSTTPTSSGTSGAAALRTGFATNVNTTASTYASHEIYIPNYAGNQIKCASYYSVTENNSAGSYYINTGALLWNDTTAVTSLQIQPSLGGTVFDSTWYLYGIKNS